jgi:hypothetical protein
VSYIDLSVAGKLAPLLERLTAAYERDVRAREDAAYAALAEVLRKAPSEDVKLEVAGRLAARRVVRAVKDE